MMSLRKHISFVAILIASTVLMAHAVIPHHHEPDTLSFCMAELAPDQGCCGAGDSHDISQGQCFNASGCHGGVGCQPTPPFTIRHGEHSLSDDEAAPFITIQCEASCCVDSLDADAVGVDYAAPSLSIEMVLGEIPRRGPPML